MALPMDDGSEQRIREMEAEYTEFLDDTVSLNQQTCLQQQQANLTKIIIIIMTAACTTIYCYYLSHLSIYMYL